MLFATPATRSEAAINPTELTCRWFGHEIKDLVVRTPKRRTLAGDLTFLVSQTCQRCGVTREDRVIGNQTYRHANARLADDFDALRAMKIKERPRL